jgi:hypothetical protein
MKIHALTVCVDYADLLALSIDRWMATLDSLLIVTSHEDEATIELAHKHKASVYRTQAFYEDGATFNKGRAMERARKSMPWHDWILFFDADIVPPVDWREQLGELAPGNLYGPRRRECPDVSQMERGDLPYPPNDCIGVGFFQLFHASDAKVQADPLLETDWSHAGIYDSHFMHRWSHQERKQLPFDVLHIGERDNWLGRGNKTGFAELMAERERRGGYQHERVAQ